MNELSFTVEAWDQYLYWQTTDKAMLGEINRLIKECLRHPFEGAGKPEPLKNEFSGFWSRRIDREQRLVYRVSAKSLEIVQCRYHY